MCYHIITFANTANMHFTWVTMHILQNNKIYIVFCKLTFPKIRGKIQEFYLFSLFFLVFLGKIPDKKNMFFNVSCHIVFTYVNGYMCFISFTNDV